MSTEGKIEELSYIGLAIMDQDGTITLKLRENLPDGGYRRYTQVYSKDDPQRDAILQHIGPIQPGKMVSVRPWPEQINH